MMKQISAPIILTALTTLLLSSCSNSDDIFKALKIDHVPAEEKRAADKKTIDELHKQLAVARSRETTLTREIAALEEKLDQQDAAVAEQIGALREAFDEQQMALTEEIETLKKEIGRQAKIISIQGKVIGLLDDADKSLQKSIQTQIDEYK